MVSSVVFALTLLAASALGGESPAYDASTNTVAHTYPASYPSKWQAGTDSGFSVQTGYEGYLVPVEENASLIETITSAGILGALAPIAKFGLKIAAKIGIWAFGLISLFLIGAAFTSTVCAFTPICTISFLGFHGFDGETVRSMMTQDKLNQATDFVMKAIHKYKSLQKKPINSKSA